MRVRDIVAFFAKHCGYTPEQTLALTTDELRVMFYALDKVIFDDKKWFTGLVHGSKATKKMKWKDPDPEQNRIPKVSVVKDGPVRPVGVSHVAEATVSRMLMDPRHKKRIIIT